ncbi:MAG TPA: hypothetical protein VMJ11_29485, partial [Paraburkholderia sp.]|nr:hypothetical protein [Paraburkholderia sp.]
MTLPPHGENNMKNTNIHQYCYGVARSVAMCVVSAGFLLPAIAAHTVHAADNDDVIRPVILLADAPLPASAAEGADAFGTPVAGSSVDGSPAVESSAQNTSDSDSNSIENDVSMVFAPNDCVSRTGSSCFRGNGGGRGGSSASSASNGGGGSAGAATAGATGSAGAA